ncbi:EAL domain-containing protein [Alteromonas sp. ASW11-36]|uniref:EAL domain-containing protein n=1 Tax=Alteromonas arenosi TaxID=3055817 RepID=A0ABT7SYV3_9ALTE|nr:EAL domain-containing protein [Alteromonas sp. ASW11-36]MDM7861373.1 EAL domain-containing protein [Alteromonas sp. ASW11-36]
MQDDTVEEHVNEGRVIFSEGEPGDFAYIVKQGVVDLNTLINGKSVRLTRFTEGELFGEMALLDKSLRSGTAVAATDTVLIKIPISYFERYINNPGDLAQTLLSVLLTRYREMRGRFTALAQRSESSDISFEYTEEPQRTAIETHHTTSKIQREIDLANALKQQQLALFYQPIVDVKSQAIVGCESLIRWIHPDRGMIPPDEFIGLAEDTGLIVPMGKWIIHEACKARNRFAEHIDNIYVSINLSPIQFESPSLVRDIESAFVSTGVKPNRIYLEITETTLMLDPLNVANILNDLKRLDAVIALDDFGTGYSSFSYLHRFPIDILKIDQSFVFTMQDNSRSKEIVRTLCSLATSLGMRTIAEGIERESDLHLLNSFAADFGQGYFIAKPMPEEDFVNFLKARS